MLKTTHFVLCSLQGHQNTKTLERHDRLLGCGAASSWPTASIRGSQLTIKTDIQVWFAVI